MDIELLTNCYLLVQGSTVAAMGSHAGLKQVRKIVEDCMQNNHPLHHIKTLMIEREIAQDPNMAHENWDRFLPKFRKSNVTKVKTEKKTRSVFPLPQTSMEIESGEFFLEEKERLEKKRKENAENQASKLLEEEREKSFITSKEKKTKDPESDDELIALIDAN